MKTQFCAHLSVPESLENTMESFKRPSPRTYLTGSRVGGILRPEDLAKLLGTRPSPPPRAKEWTPPLEYKHVARTMDAASGQAYIEKCEAWFKARPPVVTRTPSPPREINLDGMAALIKKYGPEIPLEKLTQVGYSSAAVQKVRARRQWYDDNDEKLQEDLERRWPGSSTKKVIKAVKKKMG